MKTDWRSWMPLVAAAMVLSLGMGLRQSFGLFLAPMDRDLGLGLGVFSLALALQQLFWGAFQPLAGMAADRIGPGPVLASGFALYAGGLGLFALMQTPLGAYLGIGVLSGIAVSACGFAVVLSAVAKIVPDENRSLALGIVSSGGSFGQFALAPVSAVLLENYGWLSTTWIFVALMVAIMPIGFLIRPGSGQAVSVGAAEPASTAIRIDQAMAMAFADPSYRLLSFGFFVCGFHVAFVATHLPGIIAACQLPISLGATALAVLGIGNMIGSYTVGYLGQFIRLKRLLSAIYLIRALAIGVFLLMPKTSLTFLILSSVLGITWLSTVAPTNGLVAKLHGTRYVSTLFGIVYFIHQIGGFLGAWAGGLSVEMTGGYDPVWLIAAGLAILAALAHWPIRESAIPRATIPATP
jgi:predicted MFS family arabinose efflux permease